MSDKRKTKVYAFGFDGTLTRRDPLIAFIRFSRGSITLAYGVALLWPMLLLAGLRLYDRGKCRERLFHFFFHDMSTDYFDDLCDHFARSRCRIIRAKGMERIGQAVREGCQVAVVCSCPESLARPFFEQAGLTTTGHSPQVRIVGTLTELRGCWLTGRFASPYCYGREKVSRLREVYPYRRDCRIVAFGSGRADREMMEFADDGYVEPFK